MYHTTGMDFLKETTWFTQLKLSAVVFTFVLQVYGNIRAMLYLNLKLSQIIVNTCHLVGVVMVM